MIGFGIHARKVSVMDFLSPARDVYTFPAMLLGESIRNTVRRFGASIPTYICNYAFSEFEELVYIYAFYKLLLIHTLRVYLLKKYTYLPTYFIKIMKDIFILKPNITLYRCGVCILYYFV